MGELSLVAFEQWLERSRRPDAKSVRAGPKSMRFEFWYRGVNLRQPGRGGRGHGNRWIDRVSIQRQWSGRHQADGGAGEPRGDHPDFGVAGHRGADVSHGDRCRDFVRRPGRRGSTGRGHRGVTRQDRVGLYGIPGCVGPQGRQNRRGSRSLWADAGRGRRVRGIAGGPQICGATLVDPVEFKALARAW